MDIYFLYMHYSHVLLCSECKNAFPPHEFDGQIVEFRMCSDCKKKNPEITHYLYKYVYEPQQAGNWIPFDVRLDRLLRNVEKLESDVESYKNIYCEDPADVGIYRQATAFLKDLIRKCSKP